MLFVLRMWMVIPQPSLSIADVAPFSVWRGYRSPRIRSSISRLLASLARLLCSSISISFRLRIDLLRSTSSTQDSPLSPRCRHSSFAFGRQILARSSEGCLASCDAAEETSDTGAGEEHSQDSCRLSDTALYVQRRGVDAALTFDYSFSWSEVGFDHSAEEGHGQSE